MALFTVDEAKSSLPQLIADALEGGDVMITVGNVPAVRLVPVAPSGKRRFGALKGKIAADAPFEQPLPEDELVAGTSVEARARC